MSRVEMSWGQNVQGRTDEEVKRAVIVRFLHQTAVPFSANSGMDTRGRLSSQNLQLVITKPLKAVCFVYILYMMCIIQRCP